MRTQSRKFELEQFPGFVGPNVRTIHDLTPEERENAEIVTDAGIPQWRWKTEDQKPN